MSEAISLKNVQEGGLSQLLTQSPTTTLATPGLQSAMETHRARKPSSERYERHN